MLDPYKLRAWREAAEPTEQELAARAFRRAGKKPKNIRGITQFELAQRINVISSSKREINHTYISRLETPAFIVDASASLLEKLATALHCCITDLLTPGSPDQRAKSRPLHERDSPPVVENVGL